MVRSMVAVISHHDNGTALLFVVFTLPKALWVGFRGTVGWGLVWATILKEYQ